MLRLTRLVPVAFAATLAAAPADALAAPASRVRAPATTTTVVQASPAPIPLIHPDPIQFQRTFTMCNSPTQFCAGVGLSLSGNVLTVGLKNLGTTPPPSFDSFISGFGLFGGGLTGGTLTGQGFVGTTNPLGIFTNTFAVNGAPGELDNGAGTQALAGGADFGNNGFRPCGYDDVSNKNQVRIATCNGEYGVFTFNVTSAPGSTVTLSNIGFALRAQNLTLVTGTNQTSDKCFSSDDSNCVFTSTVNIDGIPNVVPNVVPEPATVGLLGVGMLGLAGAARRRRR